MRAWLPAPLVLATCFLARPAFAQVVDPALFGDGKPPLYKIEQTDRRFLKTGIFNALNAPPKRADCQRIVATLLVAYADALPYLHRKDQTFFVDPALLKTLQRTIVSRDFPGTAYLAAMIRLTLIDKKVPDAWIATGKKLRDQLDAPIAVGRMKLDENGIKLIDSFDFTMPALLNRYARQVKLAPSVAIDAAEDKFRDNYMDRDVAWGGLLLYDIAQQAPPPPPKHRRGRHHREPTPPPAPQSLPTWAVVGFPVGKPRSLLPGLPGGGPVPQIEIRAELADHQMVDVDNLVRGQRVLIKGHLWDMGKNMSYLEVRDAYIFPDVDWRTWPGIASQRDLASCPIAVDDLSAYGYVPKNPLTNHDNAFDHQ